MIVPGCWGAFILIMPLGVASIVSAISKLDLSKTLVHEMDLLFLILSVSNVKTPYTTVSIGTRGECLMTL